MRVRAARDLVAERRDLARFGKRPEDGLPKPVNTTALLIARRNLHDLTCRWWDEGGGRLRRATFIAIALASILLLSTSPVPRAVLAYPSAPSTAKIPWRVEVRFAQPPADAASWATQRNSTLWYYDAPSKIAVIHAPDYVGLLESLRNDTSVASALPSVFLTSLFTPNDPCYRWSDPPPQCSPSAPGGQWDMRIISAPQAWDRTLGQDNIKIAVVDTGVVFLHEDLQDNAWTNPGELVNGLPIPDGQDNDGNGYIDDLHGWWFFGQGQGESNVVAADARNHGTGVAGIAGATINNGRGIAGLSNGTFLPVKVDTVAVPRTGAASTSVIFSEDLARGIAYADQQRAQVISISIGGPLSNFSPNQINLMTSAINAAWNNGSLIVAGAGNDGPVCPVYFPARLDNVIAVSATKSNDDWASYSCGDSTLDLSAPGGSAINPMAEVELTSSPAGYASGRGTSFATPHVSGVAALIWSMNNGLTNAQVRDILFNSADDKGTAGPDERFGYGRVNASKALDIIANSIPVASFTLSPEAGRSDVAFQANASQSFDWNDADNATLNYTWDWEDGITTYGLTSAHQYSQTRPDGYLLTLSVRDQAGHLGQIGRRVPVLGNPSSSPCSAPIGKPFHLNGYGPNTTDSNVPAWVSLTGQSRSFDLSVTPSDCGQEIRFTTETWTTTTDCPLPCFILESTTTTTWQSATAEVLQRVNLTFNSPGVKHARTVAEARLIGQNNTNTSDPAEATTLVLPFITKPDNTLDAGKAFAVLELHNFGTPPLADSKKTDPWYFHQWGNRFVREPESRMITTPSHDVIVAIVDSGVDIDHPDLQASVWSNGSLVGADFSSDPTIPGPNPRDELGHGTHLAGITAALENNARGVAGAAAGVQVMAVKVGVTNTTGDRLAAGIQWAVDKGAGVVLIGSSSTINSTQVYNAVANATQHGVIVVASSGNGGDDASRYPAAYPDVLSVGTVTSAAVNASFSGRGSWLDFVAPGVGLMSTWPVNATRDLEAGEFTFDGGNGSDYWGLETRSLNSSLKANLGLPYGNMSGSSAAAAHVAAVAAIVKSANATLNRSQVVKVLETSAQDLGALGFDEIYGYGLSDAFRAAVCANSFPFASFTSTISDRTVQVNGSASINPLMSSLNFTWTWGDGTPSSYGATSSHTYAGSGTYSLTLTVRNEFQLDHASSLQVVIP